MLGRLLARLPSPRRENAILTLYCLRTPMLLLMRPRVVLNTPDKVVIRVPLNWFTSNQWRTMFFAAIAAGADLTGGFAAFERAPQLSIGVLYKSFSCAFLRRIDGPLLLHCHDVQAILGAIAEADRTGARVNVDVKVSGYVEGYSDASPCVTAAMVLSLKKVAHG